MSYESLSLKQHCNVEAGWIKSFPATYAPNWWSPPDKFPVGQHHFWGIPFNLESNNDQPVFVGFGSGGYRAPIEIKIGRAVNWMVMAHRLLESHIWEGEAPGRPIYKLHVVYHDGTSEEVEARERFEIAVVPNRWGEDPFVAALDQQPGLMDRFQGRWEYMGARQTEINELAYRWFVLWAWQNPHPERVVASLQIVPLDRPFLIAAITLSSYNEDPFGREAMRPILIERKDEPPNQQNFDLSLDIDRGQATHVYPLPGQAKQSFIDDPLKGWGQAYDRLSTKSYALVTGTPSATLKIKQNGAEVGSVRWGDVTAAQSVETPFARISIIDPGRNWVRVTVKDADTGQKLPCRVHFRSPEGIPYQPHGHPNHLLSDQGTWHIDVGGDLRLGHVTYAYIDGACEGWLPRGEVLVEAAHGFEYEPVRTSVTIQPGQQELELKIKRWTDMNRAGWYSGDTHVHFLPASGALLEGQAEGLNVVNLLQSQWGHLYTNQDDQLGQLKTPDERTIVSVSQENRQHILGHLTLLGLKQPVMPWCSGGPDEAELGGTLETTLSHWADHCHAQDGTVIIPHFPQPTCEAAALVATHRADGVEMLWHDMVNHREYYRYLNCGYRLPLVGGTDKMSSSVPVGLFRTYVWIPPEQGFSYDTWRRNLSAGRTFLTSGPMIKFSVEGATMGDTVRLPRGGGTVEVWAEADSIFPIHTLEIVQGGRVVASTTSESGARRLELKANLPMEANTWLACRASGPQYENAIKHHDEWQRGLMAHTSPIYVAVGEDDWQMFSTDTANYMLTLLHGGIEHITRRSRQYDPLTTTHHHGKSNHINYLLEPFQQALAAVHQRLAHH